MNYSNYPCHPELELFPVVGAASDNSHSFEFVMNAYMSVCLPTNAELDRAYPLTDIDRFFRSDLSSSWKGYRYREARAVFRTCVRAALAAMGK